MKSKVTFLVLFLSYFSILNASAQTINLRETPVKDIPNGATIDLSILAGINNNYLLRSVGQEIATYEKTALIPGQKTVTFGGLRTITLHKHDFPFFTSSSAYFEARDHASFQNPGVFMHREQYCVLTLRNEVTSNAKVSEAIATLAYSPFYDEENKSVTFYFAGTLFSEMTCVGATTIGQLQDIGVGLLKDNHYL